MAVLTAKGVSALAVELLTRMLVLPMTVSRIPGEEFAGGNGDTITVRVPQPSVARKQANRGDLITYDDITEVPVDVSLEHLYHAKRVTDEELSFDIADFGRQITRPQVEAVASGAEAELAAAMNAMPSELSITADGSNIDAIILEAREQLGRANVPLSDRWMAVSPEVATFVLALDNVSRVDASGSPSALRDAVITRYRGFNFVESAGLTAGHAVAYHKSGFAFANRTPVTPRGVVNSTATTVANGIGVRQIFQYVPDRLSDASVVSTFAGAAPVTDAGGATPRAIKITTAP
ncbi:P22 phage major capsid protein family protein [Micromonospora sp. NPDC047465]|uniref:P22 phage major capsid protein family protein n=1 Tax=Micromonospora sp. NPDC047465 TaxID=3154813 RepID=UPI0033EEA736